MKQKNSTFLKDPSTTVILTENEIKELHQWLFEQITAGTNQTVQELRFQWIQENIHRINHLTPQQDR